MTQTNTPSLDLLCPGRSTLEVHYSGPTASSLGRVRALFGGWGLGPVTCYALDTVA